MMTTIQTGFADSNAFSRQAGQGGAADPQVKDLRAQLIEAEAAHFAKKNGTSVESAVNADQGTGSQKRSLEIEPGHGMEDGEEDIEAKRRRILEETRDVDGASSESEESSSEEESDEEDETAELLRELEKIKKERAEQKAKEEEEKAQEEQDKREQEMAYGNPLMNPNRDPTTKRRWDDDVVFRNQARGTEVKGKKEFVNDLLRSDFHKRFMAKYVR